MGINQSNIRTIIHYQLPQTLEDYVQQIGRAGRDLQFSRCIAFVHRMIFPQMGRKLNGPMKRRTRKKQNCIKI